MSDSALKKAAKRLGSARLLASFSPDEWLQLKYHWPSNARPEQLAPAGNWRQWIILAGRGFGKTRAGAEWVRGKIESGECGRMRLIGPTAADVRDVMVEGESGLLAVSPPWNRPTYEPSKRRVTWDNGAIALLYSAEEPDRLRGSQGDGDWRDELASWQYAQDVWDMAEFGLRLGANPQSCVTTTPKAISLLRGLVKDPATAITKGSTYDNSDNLAEPALKALKDRYENTRLGQQEIHGTLLEDVEGSLWKREMIVYRPL